MAAASDGRGSGCCKSEREVSIASESCELFATIGLSTAVSECVTPLDCRFCSRGRSCNGFVVGVSDVDEYRVSVRYGAFVTDGEAVDLSSVSRFDRCGV